MATIFGASVYQENGNPSIQRYDTLGKDSEVIAVGDVLAINTGVLKVAANTDVIVGVATKKATMAATNDATYPPYIPVSEQTIFLMGTNSDLTDNETDGGTYYRLSGATGAVTVDVTGGVMTTTGRQVEIVKVDPLSIGGTGSGNGLRNVLVRFVKTPYTNINITA